MTSRATMRALYLTLTLVLISLPVLAGPCAENDRGFWCFADPSERELHFARQRNPEEAFSVTMHQIDSSRFPIIGAYVSVLDSEGYTIPDIPAGLFRLTENCQVLPFELDTVASEEGGVKVALVMDVSGSMLGQKIFEAKNAAMLFVYYMKTLDRAAVVSYESAPHLVQGFTSVKNDLRDALLNLDAGGATAMYDGMYLALDLTKEERGVKAIIAFTDGLENNSTHSEQELLDYASQTGIPIFTIGYGTDADEDALRRIAEATGGLYGFALDGQALAELYVYLAHLVENEYLLVYRTPDEQFDRLPRIVEVCVDYWNEEKCSLGMYRATEPPRIVLTEETKRLSSPGYSHAQGAAIEVKAVITDDEDVKQARVLWRQCGLEGNPYLENVMALDQFGYYVSTFPSQFVKSPGIEYLILASDEYTTVSEPAFMPESYPHKIAIQPNFAPTITHQPRAAAVVGQDMLLSTRVTDDTDYVHSVVVLVRQAGKQLFDRIEVLMILPEESYLARIPGEYMTDDGMEYCIYATDNHGVSSWHGTPAEPHFVVPHLMSKYPIYVYARDKAKEEVPLRDASVYVNGEQVGATDARGLLMVDSLSIDDEVFAIKTNAGRVLAMRDDHGAVDDTQFVLDLHNACFTRESGFRTYVTTDLVPETPDNRQPILLSHVTVGVNLVVSIEFDASADYIDNVVAGLSKVSDLLFDATNGQFRINDVAVYDAKQYWENADVRVFASSDKRPCAAIGGVAQRPNWLDMTSCVLPWGFSRDSGPLGDNALEKLNSQTTGACNYFTDPHLTSELLHLLGHYLFSLMDENISGDLSEMTGRTASMPLKPRNFGVMDAAYLGTEFSSWNDYPGRYSASGLTSADASSTTLQMENTGLPCWQLIKQRIEAIPWTDVDYDIDIAIPRVVYYTQNGQDVEIPGPGDAGGLSNVTVFDNQAGAFDATLLLTFEHAPVADASVFIESPDFSFRGRTDKNGKISLLGVKEGQRVVCFATNKEWQSASYPYCVGETMIQAAQTTYPVECQPPGQTRRGATAAPTRAIISGNCRTTAEGASLDLLVLTGELIPNDPMVTVDTDALGKQDVDMSRATDETFLGSISVGPTSTGAIQVELLDSDDDVAVSRDLFSIHTVHADRFNEIVSADGGVSLLLKGGEVPNDQPLLIIASRLLPPNPPADKVLITKVYSIALEGDALQLNPGSEARLVFHLGHSFWNGTNCRSFAVHRHNDASGVWERLGGVCQFGTQAISVRTNRLGVFAVFGLTSDKTEDPRPPHEFVGSSGECKSQVRLTFRAPQGDDSWTTVAWHAYEVRYSDRPIFSDDDFSSAKLLFAPEGYDLFMRLLYDMPEPHKEFYFAARSVDEAGNVSDIVTASGKSPAAETLYFDAQAHNGSVELIWETGSEIDNGGWHIWQYHADVDEFTRLTSSPELPKIRPFQRQRYTFEAHGQTNAEPSFFVIENLCTDGSSSYSHLISTVPNSADIPHPPSLEATINDVTFADGDTLQIGASTQNQDETLLVWLEVFLVEPNRRIVPISPSFPFFVQPYERKETTVYTAVINEYHQRGEYEVWARLKDAATGAVFSKQDLFFTVTALNRRPDTSTQKRRCE
ncbi:MAG: VWA domain-containing protein [Candidatus Coatesbacteria bacterium]|nr:VWA domain-containing protein [Candidatus Coatesbacteria bacterium]